MKGRNLKRNWRELGILGEKRGKSRKTLKLIDENEIEGLR